ncbi:glycosyltransferase family 4 protein, partial [bacterium]|nr:glycosyltransferase family 4 protein [bacterium]
RSLGGLFHSMGHEMHFLMEGEKVEPLKIEEGRVWQIMPTGGAPLLKLIHPKGSTLVRFLKEQKIDLLVQRGASELTALGAAVARKAGIPFLFLLASDSDLKPGCEILTHPQNHVLYRMTLAKARWVVAQTSEQADLLARNYGISPSIIPSMLPKLPEEGFGDYDRNRVLWGGNLRSLKRPEWLLALAKRFPKIQFEVFGGKAGGHESYAQGIIEQFELQTNLNYLGWVSNQDVPQLFSRARIFLNTSLVEGFPNSFLEAWRQNVPVVSTVDPGELLSRQKLGYFEESLDKLALRLHEIWQESSPDLQLRLQNALQYVDDIHGRESVAGRWAELLKMLEQDSAIRA